MKMNKAVAAVAAGMIAFGSVFSASAAGIGYVNFDYLMNSHPKMQKAQLDFKAAAQKASETFRSKAAGKTDQEKQQIATDLDKELQEKERSLITPIRTDVIKAIQQVRQEKSLDVILEQAAVVDGGVDVTSAVAQKLAK